MTTGQRDHEPDRRDVPEPNLAGISPEWRRDLDERLVDFETRHQYDVVHGGPGWVPRIRRSDYAIAIAVNVVIVIWLAAVLLGGE